MRECRAEYLNCTVTNHCLQRVNLEDEKKLEIDQPPPSLFVLSPPSILLLEMTRNRRNTSGRERVSSHLMGVGAGVVACLHGRGLAAAGMQDAGCCASARLVGEPAVLPPRWECFLLRRQQAL